MKLLLDMNLSPWWLEILQPAKIEAVHWSTVGNATAPDNEIMTYAVQRGYIVLTQDLDFSAVLAATNEPRPSVVQIRSADVSAEVIGPQVISALLQMEAELEAGALLTVDPKRTRLRLLPLTTKQSS